jgi:Ca2+-binding RTX toxin-like protein
MMRSLASACLRANVEGLGGQSPQRGQRCENAVVQLDFISPCTEVRDRIDVDPGRSIEREDVRTGTALQHIAAGASRQDVVVVVSGQRVVVGAALQVLDIEKGVQAGSDRVLQDRRGKTDHHPELGTGVGSSIRSRVGPGAGSEKNTLKGDDGDDTMKGQAGADTLIGGVGADKLTGGLDADLFVYTASNQSTVATAGRDTLYDFSQAQSDKIDLSAMDADSTLAGNQAFIFIAAATFSNTAGELRAEITGTSTLISADTNGDGTADFSVLLKGMTTMTGSDFIV